MAALYVLSLPFHVFGLYALTLVLLAKLRRRPALPEPKRAAPRIAVIVVAHDEERVVASSVNSLGAQRYPENAFTVYVVADHCSDRTADVAREAGARVLVRDGGGATGKSAAVAFGVQAVAAERGFDAVAIFDADNAVDPDFLELVGARLSAGDRVVQGFVDSKNPAASWVAGSSALGFWAIAELSQAPRERLGLSTPLMGTGFAIELSLAERLLTVGGALTDDLDLASQLALDGVRVAYEPRARTFDEKPTELRTAVAQRHRWMQGRWAVATRWVPGLLRHAIGQGTLLERWTALDVAVQLLAPSLLFTAVVTALFSGVAAGLAVSGAPGNGTLIRPSLAAAALYYFVPVFGIARHHPSARVWVCYLVQPMYLVLSLPLAVSGFLTRRTVRWIRTPKGT